MSAVHELYGVAFTQEQWDATRAHPPAWEANPPQREEYEDDTSYALGLREYAIRAIPALKKRNLTTVIP